MPADPRDVIMTRAMQRCFFWCEKLGHSFTDGPFARWCGYCHTLEGVIEVPADLAVRE